MSSPDPDGLWAWPVDCPASGGVRLRHFHDEDGAAAVALSADPYVPLIGTLPAHASAAQAAQWVTAQRGRLAERAGFSFAVADSGTDVCVGFAGLWLRQIETGVATAGYAIVPASRGGGRAIDALTALTAFAWTLPPVLRIELHIEPWNVASRGVAARVGYAEEALLPRGHEVGGELRDVLQYVMARTPAR
ncbi:Protein N-acetyltransferase, RimJ/RimL family [Modestobacter sp. DSM 44400]|uniref:GNAT family N-acetyltransferase n=1 Tax=Modestobacter sp. DSM 44400 TaxID=1550230 RepID=UPI000899F20E|nr:GNAT family protein [Modestobacter sp. DSM 44400]SDX60148.1 Protein N-acetyltransferase, RimJ/RimL family [Modestobacter sp. DSM 44400]